ncbi:PLP-dependent aminotransferase family protein [Kribbella yunnanensis]|uniref:PLP-dependent aminotransferase family protein n=1 Tax=Kribbella yunnanensis TaxID=190194 RepID=A0ABP4TJW9_9ACTN
MDRITTDQLTRMLVGTGTPTGPLYRRLSEGLAELIDRGELPPGAVLPPERALAVALTMSRTTVVAAYQELQAGGLVERRRGSGTRVRTHARHTVSSRELAGDHAASQFLDGPPATIDFMTAALPSLGIVADVAASLTRDDYLQLTTTHHGYHLKGLPSLRERIASWYGGSDDILITAGAQQALELVGRGCLQPGDRVIVEDPTYRGALDAFARTGSRLCTVALDSAGLDVDALEKLLVTEAPRLVYVQASGHNPTGVVMTADRRRRLTRLLDRYDFILVDDTSLAGTAFAPTPSTLGTHERLLTIGSLSKVFWGGLRLGWIRGAPQTVARLAQVRGISDLGSSLVAQEVARRLFDHYEDAVAERRTTLPVQLRTLTGLLQQHLPDCTWQEPAAGASLWVRLPHGTATQWSQLAQRYGVALLPGAVFGSSDDHTRIPFTLPVETLRAGIERLSRVATEVVGYPTDAARVNP